jgi:tRNA-dihydrouridine synthase
VSLLWKVEQHMRETGEHASVLGRRALGDPNLVRNMRNGRELRPQTAERLRRYLAESQGQRG